MKKAVSILLVILMIGLLCACSSESVSGKYILTKVIKMDGTVMTGEEFDRDEFSITLHEDGTTVVVSEGDVAGTCQWVYEDGKLYLESNGQREEFDYKDNTITLITRMGDTWIYTKQ